MPRQVASGSCDRVQNEFSGSSCPNDPSAQKGLTVIHRILVATDRSDTATRAVAWAAEMSGRYEAELLVFQVIAPEHMTGETAEDQLAALTQEVCGSRGRPLVVYDSDPAAA